MGVAAAIGAGAAVVGAGASVAGQLGGAGKGAQGQQQSQYLQQVAANQAIAFQQPFIQPGQIAAQQLPGAVGTPMDLSGQPTVANLPTPPPAFSWNPTMAGLEQTPGYQFTLQQGLQAAQNQATMRGLGISGAAMKANDAYVTGLASQTYNQQLNNAESIYQNQLQGYQQSLAGFNAGQGAYQNQFNDYWANQQNRYNQLSNLATLGANVSVGAGSQQIQAGANIGNAAAQAGAYQGAGTANALNTLGNTLASPQVQSGLTGAYNWLTGQGGSTIGAPLSVASSPGSTATWTGQV